MSRLEDLLKEAMHRREPPAGFTERVLSRIANERPIRNRRKSLFDLFRLPQLRWAGALAAMIALVAGVEFYRQRQIRIEGELAKEQVMLALRITASELQYAKQKVLKLRTTP